MPEAWVEADFNGLLAKDLLCLSHEESITDASGRVIHLRPGLILTAFEPGADDEGQPSYLVATGLVEPAPDDASRHGAKWVLRIDERGIRYESRGGGDA